MLANKGFVDTNWLAEQVASIVYHGDKASR